MATPTQVTKQIHFHLDQLGSQNGHHEFEHLCRKVARLRICSNILPATGPVSAGGDQGRDFETYRTTLTEEPTAGSLFFGLASTEQVGFACTLQRSRIGQKIKADVKTIVGQGSTVHQVHFFCVVSVPVSKRHTLQEWAKSETEVHLEIHDGLAISDYLAEPELFWIASEHLGIPAEIYPPPTPDAENAWYLRARDEWREAEREPETFADFEILKHCIRHATFTEDAKPDLPRWIALLKLLRSRTSARLRRRCSYEILVASLRGQGSLVGREKDVVAFFSEIRETTDPADLEDASVLWAYCAGAQLRGLLDCSREILSEWWCDLSSRTRAQLEGAESPGLRCLNLETLGYLQFMGAPDAEKFEVGVEEALETWTTLSENVREDPLFPLERFADRLTEVVVLCRGPQLDTLTGKIDDLLAQRHGGFVSAQKCLDRASKFRGAGDTSRAIKQLHQAKIKWFADEMLHGSVFAMLMLSRLYLDLGLTFAAKYYALVAGYIALESPKDDLKKLAPKAVAAAADSDYSQGAWFSFLDLAKVFFPLDGTYSPQPSSEEADEFHRELFHLYTVLRINRHLDLGAEDLLKERARKMCVLDYMESLERRTQDPLEGKPGEEVWSAIEDQLIGPPFSDAGSQRAVSFLALGIRWRFRWKNAYVMTAAAEELLAVLQVLLADLASLDLCLLRTTIEVEFAFSDDPRLDLKPVPSNEASKWMLSIPRSPGAEYDIAEVTAIAVTLISSGSLFPWERLRDIVEESYRGGLGGKVFAVRRYRTAYTYFVEEGEFQRSKERFERGRSDLGREFHLRCPQQMEWHSGPGPGYSPEQAQEAIRQRYKRSVSPVRWTLKTLKQSSRFQNIAKTLQEEDWKDWHILMAVMNAAMNYRAAKITGPDMTIDERKKLLQHLAHEEESDRSIRVPVEVFSLESLRFGLRMSMISTIQGYGLEPNRETPDIDAIEDFLAKRYRYWDDDVEHEPFGW